MNKLSRATCSCWAKKSFTDGIPQWLPLVSHMCDSVAVANMLWENWLSQGVKSSIISSANCEEDAKKLVLFIAAIHDLGKATPVFQVKKSRPPCSAIDQEIAEKLIRLGLLPASELNFPNANKTHHALAAQVLLRIAGCNINVASIIGSHHGKPPSNGEDGRGQYEAYGSNYHSKGEYKKAWQEVQQELIQYAFKLSGFNSLEDLPKPHLTAQVLLSGLLIMIDWIASNDKYFPYIPITNSASSIDNEKRMSEAWHALIFPKSWITGNTWMNSDLYQIRFGYSANILQQTVAQTVGNIDEPGIVVIEAAMGDGKTEAALAGAEIFSQKTEKQGIFFALPTQATSDGIFPRLLKWINHLDPNGEHVIKLAHGKAQFNKEYMALKGFEGSKQVNIDDVSGAFVHEWFEGQKRSLLADFVVGTIDQLLMSALKQKHVMLRHLGLAGKVVIIDECHAYDAYMGSYLNRALNWLGAYKVPVIVLSATLPAEKRKAVIAAYLGKDTSPRKTSLDSFAEKYSWMNNREYPLITYTDGKEIRQVDVKNDSRKKTIKITYLSEDSIVETLNSLLDNGGCAGILVNTVRKAQDLAVILHEVFGKEIVRLLHSRFLAPDRADKEEILLKELGKPNVYDMRPSLRIVVGTQVLEQSLDIDFDVMITDWCPMDLLLQRLGRLHRHSRLRPDKVKNPQCFIIDYDNQKFDSSSVNIYGDCILMRTRFMLPSQLELPTDIPNLVQNVYDIATDLPEDTAGYIEAKDKWLYILKDKEERAKNFQIAPAWSGQGYSLNSWLDTSVDSSDKKGEAAVRDTDQSIEVLVVQEKFDGRICFLPWIEQNMEIPLHQPPSNEIAIALARQRIRLPQVFCAPWIIDKTISEIEDNNAILLEWQKSPWIKGELVLILDEKLKAKIGGYQIQYSEKEGLMYDKEDSINV